MACSAIFDKKRVEDRYDVFMFRNSLRLDLERSCPLLHRLRRPPAMEEYLRVESILDSLVALTSIGTAIYEFLPSASSCASVRKAMVPTALTEALPSWAKSVEVPPEPVPQAVQSVVEWAKGFTHGTCAGHPHCGALAADGGYLVVGDCANYFQDEGGGNVGTGKHWPRQLTRAILVTKVSKEGEEQWSYRYDHGIGRNYVSCHHLDTCLPALDRTPPRPLSHGSRTISEHICRVSCRASLGARSPTARSSCAARPRS